MKYKITFKADDDMYKDHSQAILEFLKKEYPKAKDIEMSTRNTEDLSNLVYYYYVIFSSALFNQLTFSYMYWPAQYSIRKKNDWSDDYILMSKNELKFFDSLNLELFNIAEEATGQTITDWWDMRDDEV